MKHYTITRSVLLASLLAGGVTAEDLGSVSVESSTITYNIASKTEASTVNHIGTEQIEEINPKQINELLQTLPGITSDVRPGEVVEIHMRGIGQQEFMWEDTGVAIIIDGVPIWQNGGKFRINMSDIKNIKVIKGGASYLYGNTALAGAVVITTSKPRGKNAYTLSGETGSYNYRDLTATAMKSAGDYALNFNANYRTTDGYWVDSGLWSKSLGGKFTYFLDDTSDVTLGVDVTRKFEEKQRGSTKGVTEASTNPRGNGRNSFQKENFVDLDKYFVTYSKDFDKSANLLLNAYHYLDTYDYISSPQDTTGDGLNDTYTSHSNQDIIQQGLKLEYRDTLGNLAYLVAFEHAKRNYNSASEKLADYNSTSRGRTTYYYKGETSETINDETRNALYGELKYGFTPDFTATFNMRHDMLYNRYAIDAHDFDGTAWSDTKTERDRNFAEDSYRLGGAYALTHDTSLYANFSTGFRTPTVDQIFAGDIKGGNYVNNESIATQKTLNYELGIRGKTPGGANAVRYELALFQTDNRDIIARKDGTYYSGDEVYFDNVGDARNRGVELSLKGDLSTAFTYSLAYTYLKAEYTKHNLSMISFNSIEDQAYGIVGNELPRTPNHTLDLYTTYRLTPALRFISELYARSGYYADETNLITMPGYAFVNLQTRYDFQTGFGDFELFAKLNNAFDKQYYKTVFLTNDSNKDDLFDAEDATITVDPGRVYYVGLRCTF